MVAVVLDKGWGTTATAEVESLSRFHAVNVFNLQDIRLPRMGIQVVERAQRQT